FPKLFNPQMAPWAKYHANLYNDGNVTTQLPTPVGGATFAFSVRSGHVDLTWNLPLDAGTRFSVDRAEVVAGVASSYRRVASNLPIALDGSVRLVESDLDQGARYTFRLENEKGEVVHESASLYIPVERAGLGQNYPNPFNPATRIEYWVPDGAGGQGGEPV